MKNDTNELIYKIETENELNGYQRGRESGGMDWESGIDNFTVLYLKQMMDKDPLCSTGKYSIKT